MKYTIKDIATGKLISEYELGMLMYTRGEANNIIFCDIEGIAEMDGDYYLLDECGNWAYIDTTKYELKGVV